MTIFYEIYNKSGGVSGDFFYANLLKVDRKISAIDANRFSISDVDVKQTKNIHGQKVNPAQGTYKFIIFLSISNIRFHKKKL